MFINIIIFFIILIILTIILQYSKSYKEGFFAFPVANHNEFVQQSADKFNALTNTINLVDPAVPVSSDSAAAFKIALGGLVAEPTPDNYNLRSKTDFTTPSDIPNTIKLAKSCEKAGRTCSAFDDPTFAANCGMSFDIKGVGADGKPHIGGMFISTEDRTRQTNLASDVVTTGGAPYDPYKVYQPTLGKSAPGTFAITKDDCVVVKEKVDCATKQTFSSPNCTQCYTTQRFSRVGPDTPRLPSTISFVGNGFIYVAPTNAGGCHSWNSDEQAAINAGKNQGDVCNATSGQFYQGADNLIPQCGGCWCCENVPFALNGVKLDPTNPVVMNVAANSEGVTFNISVETTDGSLAYVAGLIQGQTPRGTFSLDIFNLINKDFLSGGKPKINGTTSVNGITAVVMVPSVKNTVAVSGMIPFSFISMFDGDALTCQNGPIITQAASATFLESDPCFGSTNKPGNYKLECLQSRWVELGGTQQGSGYPSNQTNADAIQKDGNGVGLNIDDIINTLAPKIASALTGKDASGTPLSLANWNTLSLWATGIPINTPCDGPNGSTGPLSQECLSYLYLNQGVSSHIGPTYTLPSVSNASSIGQNTANTYCQPGTQLDPSTSTGLSFGQNLGGINAVKQTYDQINRLANDNTQTNTARASAVQACYGVNIDSEYGNSQYQLVENGFMETSGPQPSCFNNLSVQQAQQGCNDLGPLCAGFSYAKDGSFGCYKGDLKGGMRTDTRFIGYNKLPLQS